MARAPRRENRADGHVDKARWARVCAPAAGSCVWECRAAGGGGESAQLSQSRGDLGAGSRGLGVPASVHSAECPREGGSGPRGLVVVRASGVPPGTSALRECGLWSPRHQPSSPWSGVPLSPPSCVVLGAQRPLDGHLGRGRVCPHPGHAPSPVPCPGHACHVALQSWGARLFPFLPSGTPGNIQSHEVPGTGFAPAGPQPCCECPRRPGAVMLARSEGQQSLAGPR